MEGTTQVNPTATDLQNQLVCGNKMLTLIPDTADLASLERVVVIYESPATRDHAFHHLTGRFSPDRVEHFHWCHSAQLNDDACLEALIREACGADLVIFAITTEGEFNYELKSAIERWLAKRDDREGAIVGLVKGAIPGSTASLKEIYLRHIAHRAGMDYLSHLTSDNVRAMPNSLDNFSHRAGQMTSVLDQILHTKMPSTLPR